MVFSGNANKRLAEEVCRYLGIPLGQAAVGRFPMAKSWWKSWRMFVVATSS